MDATSGPVKYNRASDIIFKLKKKEGEVGITSTGLIDNRLFTGTNNLHAIMDKQTCLWHLQYDSGILPLELKTQYTSYKKALAAVTDYFNRRNIEIVDVVDGPAA
jgi:hypothetical protein